MHRKKNRVALCCAVSRLPGGLIVKFCVSLHTVIFSILVNRCEGRTTSTCGGGVVELVDVGLSVPDESLRSPLRPRVEEAVGVEASALRSECETTTVVRQEFPDFVALAGGGFNSRFFRRHSGHRSIVLKSTKHFIFNPLTSITIILYKYYLF